MFRQPDKQRAYLIFCACYVPLMVLSQERKISVYDTMQLHDVLVTASRISFSETGKKTETIDSSVKSYYLYNSIADALSFNSAMHIKTYGPGGLSSSALRGGSAEQTAILWNGFNLQNTMLGQSDLALMPSALFDEMSVEYGGSSALWGSGAVGGSIHLNNRQKFRQGLKVQAGAGAGSYGLRNAHAKACWSSDRFVTSTKIFFSEAVNDFEFMGSGNQQGEILQQQKAGYTFRNVLQEFKFRLNDKQVLTLNGWLNKNDRQLPSFAQSANSKTTQQDDAVRLSANWNFIDGKFSTIVRSAFFQDNVNYTDSLFPIFSRSKTQTLMLENENYFQWLPDHQLNVGFSALTTSAQSTYYQNTNGISRLSFIAANHSWFFKNALSVVGVGRVEYFSMGALPVTGNLALDWKFLKNFSIGANFAKVYRQPTLNELYWIPGGNPSLRPEQGFTSEGVVRYFADKRAIKFNASVAAYSKNIRDWVLWVPGAGGQPSPMNLQQVWSRGLESTWKIFYNKNKYGAEFRFISSYVLSTIVSNEQENNNSINKQLIYTPVYTFNGSIILRYGSTSLALFDQYVGYRFTSTDNEEWLMPYHVSSLRLNQQSRIKKADISFFVSCNNVFNADYQVLENRPMPLRNYELGLTIGLRHKKPEINQQSTNQ